MSAPTPAPAPASGLAPSATGVLSKVLKACTKLTSPNKKKEKRHTWKGDAASSFSSITQGAVRFPGSRRMPARWARVDVSSEPIDTLQLLTKQWHVRSHEALFSVIGLMPEDATSAIDEQQLRVVHLWQKQRVTSSNTTNRRMRTQ